MKNYRLVATEDGSNTLYSNLYNEACHSTTGAVEETKLHYIQGCEISARAQAKSQNHQQTNVLEVGFGVGIGFLQTEKLFKHTDHELYFVSFEIDLELIEIFEHTHGIKFTCNSNVYSYKKDNITFKIYLGDARDTIKQLEQEKIKFHAIYQDAFSPKRNAILWTTDWFRELKKLSESNCIMSTYSSSSSIRKSMIAAGWSLYEGHKFGHKRSSTRARLTGDTEQGILDKLARSPAIELTDDNYQDYTL